MVAQVEVSYKQQFDSLHGSKDLDVISKALPKCSLKEQRKEPGAKRLPFSDVYYTDVNRPLLKADPLSLHPYQVSTSSASPTHSRLCRV